MEYVWIAVLVVSLVTEAITTDLVAVWFFPSSVVAIILAVCGVPWYVQLPVFLVLGVALVAATRPICKKWLDGKKIKTGTELLLGQTALVTEEICNLEERGEVRINGLCWSARAQDPALVIAVGEQVSVLEIRGVKVIVCPVAQQKT
jgi:membrane protein implicated in regulation of membrane protease activity